MAETKNIKSRIVHKHDIETNWLKATNFIPKQGEIIIYDIDDNYDYERFKIGDGQTVVSELPFSNEKKILYVTIAGSDEMGDPIVSHKASQIYTEYMNGKIIYLWCDSYPETPFYLYSCDMASAVFKGEWDNYINTLAIDNNGGFRDTYELQSCTITFTKNRQGNYDIDHTFDEVQDALIKGNHISMICEDDYPGIIFNPGKYDGSSSIIFEAYIQNEENPDLIDWIRYYIYEDDIGYKWGEEYSIPTKIYADNILSDGLQAVLNKNSTAQDVYIQLIGDNGNRQLQLDPSNTILFEDYASSRYANFQPSGFSLTSERNLEDGSDTYYSEDFKIDNSTSKPIVEGSEDMKTAFNDWLGNEAMVDEKLAAFVDSAPDTLNTLNELAAALGDDPNFATTVATELGKKVDKEEGKVLSSNDFTDAEKAKLAGIAEGANKYVLEKHTHETNQLTFGSGNTINLDPVMMAYNGESASNKTYGLQADYITLEYSTDGGTTWIDYGASDKTKEDLFSETRWSSIKLGGHSNKTPTLDCMARVTIIPALSNETSNRRYCEIFGLFQRVCTNGHTLVFDMELSPYTDQTSFTKVKSDVQLSGWEGNNMAFHTFTWGGQNNWSKHTIRLTYKIKSLGTGSSLPYINDIRFYGGTVHNVGNQEGRIHGNMMRYNAPYEINSYNQTVSFPCTVAVGSLYESNPHVHKGFSHKEWTVSAGEPRWIRIAKLHHYDVATISLAKPWANSYPSILQFIVTINEIPADAYKRVSITQLSGNGTGPISEIRVVGSTSRDQYYYIEVYFNTSSAENIKATMVSTGTNSTLLDNIEDGSIPEGCISTNFTPEANTIKAEKFKGDLQGNADTATKATQDADGNVISDTYISKDKIGDGLTLAEDGTLSTTGGGEADSIDWENVQGKPENIVNFIGSVSTISDLPVENNSIGDVYQIQTEGVLNGTSEIFSHGDDYLEGDVTISGGFDIVGVNGQGIGIVRVNKKITPIINSPAAIYNPYDKVNDYYEQHVIEVYGSTSNYTDITLNGQGFHTYNRSISFLEIYTGGTYIPADACVMWDGTEWVIHSMPNFEPLKPCGDNTWYAIRGGKYTPIIGENGIGWCGVSLSNYSKLTDKNLERFIHIGNGQINGENSILLSTMNEYNNDDPSEPGSISIECNTPNTFQVNQFPLLDLETGKIHADRIDTTNIDIEIPTPEYATYDETSEKWDLNARQINVEEYLSSPYLELHDSNFNASISLSADSDGYNNLVMTTGDAFKGTFRTDSGGKITSGPTNSIQIWSSENKTWEGDGILTIGEDSLTYTVNTGIENGTIVGNTYNIYHEGNKPTAEDLGIIQGIPVVHADVDEYGEYYVESIPEISELTAGQTICFIPGANLTHTGDVNFSIYGAGGAEDPQYYNKIYRYVSSGGARRAAIKGDFLQASRCYLMTFDGTNWMMAGLTKPSATDLHSQVPIASGGTGASDATTALTNLGAVAKSGDTMTGDLTIQKNEPSAITLINTDKGADAVIKEENNVAVLACRDVTGDNTNQRYIAVANHNYGSGLNQFYCADVVDGEITPYYIKHSGNFPLEAGSVWSSIKISKYGTTASGDRAIGFGYSCTASGSDSATFGYQTQATGLRALSGGFYSKSTGSHAITFGEFTTSQGVAQAVFGKYNTLYSGATSGSDTSGSIFIIGNGTDDTARSNAFRVSNAGVCYGKSSFQSSGADYAEYFEWADGNPDNEDRRGYFVTLDGDKIRKATPNDIYVLGVVSSTPMTVGASYSDEWKNKYLTDVYGKRLTEVIEVPEEIDEEGNVIPAHTETRFILNPKYDPNEQYISREERKEWDMVGVVGQLIVIDNGNCKVNEYCSVGANGIAIPSSIMTDYRVIERIDENHIKIFIK